MAFERIGGFKISSQSVDTITVTDGILTVDSSSDGSSGGEVVLKESAASGGKSITVAAPDAVTASVTLTLPDGTGNSGEFMKTDGNGVMSWAPTSSSLSASDIIQIQIFS